MPRIKSFHAIGEANAKVLILGSMPGKKSLEQQQYYAHPQNAFWKIMGNLFGAYPALSYEQRLQVLMASGIALWDVLASCIRTSSLDAHIEKETANNFTEFFLQHPHIEHVLFNGEKAAQCFRKFVQGKQALPPLTFFLLPSTSPTHAGMSYEEKLKEWRKQLSHTQATLNP